LETVGEPSISLPDPHEYLQSLRASSAAEPAMESCSVR
jgi:hypothetical protein